MDKDVEAIEDLYTHRSHQYVAKVKDRRAREREVEGLKAQGVPAPIPSYRLPAPILSSYGPFYPGQRQRAAERECMQERLEQERIHRARIEQARRDDMYDRETMRLQRGVDARRRMSPPGGRWPTGIQPVLDPRQPPWSRSRLWVRFEARGIPTALLGPPRAASPSAGCDLWER